MNRQSVLGGKESSVATVLSRRRSGGTVRTLLWSVLLVVGAYAQTDPLPSWNEGAAKQAILDFVRATTDQSSPSYVPSEQRIATFDQDGTLWVEHPIYRQMMYCLDRVPAVVAAKPELKKRRAVQDRPVRRPRRDREAHRCRTSRRSSSPRSPA